MKLNWGNMVSTLKRETVAERFSHRLQTIHIGPKRSFWGIALRIRPLLAGTDGKMPIFISMKPWYLVKNNDVNEHTIFIASNRYPDFTALPDKLVVGWIGHHAKSLVSKAMEFNITDYLPHHRDPGYFAYHPDQL